MTILYIAPARGGIADYSRQIRTIYGRLGHELIVKTPGDKLPHGSFDMVHLELGAGDGAVMRLGMKLLRTKNVPQLVTVHDPGMVVAHPFDLPGTAARSKALQFGAKVMRKLVNKSAGHGRINRYLKNPLVHQIVLRPNLADESNVFYLPQPTYHETMLKPLKKRTKSVAYAGFWGRAKGLETLLEAWELMPEDPSLILIIAGHAAVQHDTYEQEMDSKILKLKRAVMPTGFIDDADFDTFFKTLGALVLPYWPELPSGTSAMALRAAELGTPIIASDIPALRGQLGDEAIYVPAHDSERLAQALQEFEANQEQITQQAAKAQADIYAEHGWDVVGDRLAGVLEAVMKDQA